jgi:alanyl-tRNA synthetase
MLTANDIRKLFLEYYESHGHTVVPSSPIYPKDDPSLLFTNAGMVQFKKTFLGQEKRDYIRATTSQKCLRVGGKHNDLENVGRTARHHTFFEMLGNFSFGDYFKEDAITFAWGFLTDVLKLPQDRLYITCFTDDDEAENIWKRVSGLPPERMKRLGEKDNFWSMGDTGPCGPCSEIHIDQGEHMTCGPDCALGVCDCDRFLEIWNLVFMQYDQVTVDKRDDLPRPSIDTGMGLERIAAVCQGVYSNYDIDLFQKIIGFTGDMVGVKYRENEDSDTALRVIADHARAAAFMIADGILPSNEGRGYVLRRLIRRAYRFGSFIGFKEPFMHAVAGKVTDIMGDAFPELTEGRDFAAQMIREEEERFGRTLDKGLELLEEELAALKKQGATTVPGDVAFKLYDTFGFPIDIVNDIAEKQGFAVDEAGYNAHMKEQKERAKAAWKGSGETDLMGVFSKLIDEGVRSEFVGYDQLTASGEVNALLNASAEPVDALRAGEKGYVVCTKTPFYGESGGQLGDTGSITGASGTAQVNDTLKPSPELFVHHIALKDGKIEKGDQVDLEVAEGPRTATARNHTATHLLHSALRNVLGSHVKQAGSLVGPDRLRFDFNHFKGLSPEELTAVEQEVNAAILADAQVCVDEMDYEAAVNKGAIALFGEKYEEKVRVVEVGGVSVELCGGTHLNATGQVGLFLIQSETGVAAGTRRIEASTGLNSFAEVEKLRHEAAEIAGLLKAKPGESAARVKALSKEVRSLKKDMEKLAAQAASSKGGDIMDELTEIGGVKVLAVPTGAPNMGALRKMMDDVRSKLASGVACLTASHDGKISLIVYVSKDLHDRFTAPGLIKDVAAEVGGSGGGRPDMAQAGGTNPDGIDAAFAKLKEILAG